MGRYIPQIIQSLITERAMAYEAKRLGYKVSDEDVAAAIRHYIPQLFQDGKFAGKDAYAQVLAQQNLTIPMFEADVARQLLIQKMQGVATESIIVSPQEVEQEYKHRNDKVQIAYVKLSADQFKSEVQVTPEELHKNYEGNKIAYQVRRSAAWVSWWWIRPSWRRAFNPRMRICSVFITTIRTAIAFRSG